MDLKAKDFEGALKELEDIVRELEKGELTLEQSLACYERGVRLARFCNDKLEEAEKRIEVLRIDDQGEPRRDATGEVVRAPIPLEEEENG